MRIRLLVFALTLSLPALAEAAGAPRTFRELASQIVDILSVGVGSLVALALVIFLWGIARNMMKLQEGEPAAYRAFIMWGIIIIFVMVSIWGILNLLKATFFQGEDDGPPPPITMQISRDFGTLAYAD